MTASHAFAPSLPQETQPPPLLKFSFICFCIFNLANFSRVFELKFAFLHIPLIMGALALMGAAMEGRLAAVFGTKIGMCMTVLTVLYAINVPLSSWRGGSMAVFVGEWLKTFTMFAISGALIFNLRQCRTALYSIGFGSGIAGVIVNVLGQQVGGRLSMGRGTLGNSNEIAFDLLLGLPFLWLVMKDSGSGTFKKLLAAPLIVSGVIGILRTGSRAGLIGFAMMGLLFFLRSSFFGKMVMAFCVIALALAALAFLPSNLKLRYASTFAGSDSDAAMQAAINGGDESAVLSAAGRRQLLINSLKVTMDHPLFGCGIGEFGPYMAGLESAAGLHAGWQGTHNTYTQISSEAGIPALITFVCMIFFSITGVRGLAKRAKARLRPGVQLPDIIDVAFALTAALVAYAVCVCFDYVAYSATLPVLAALAIALMRCGNLELDRLDREPVPEPASQVINVYPVRARAMRPATF